MPSLETFSLEIRPDRARVVLLLAGELDIASVDDVRAAVDELHAAGWEHIRLDLTDVSFVDSRGLRLLISLNRLAKSEGWGLLVVGDCPALERVLELACPEAALQRPSRRPRRSQGGERPGGIGETTSETLVPR